jgi:hypothetical protein
MLVADDRCVVVDWFGELDNDAVHAKYWRRVRRGVKYIGYNGSAPDGAKLLNLTKKTPFLTTVCVALHPRQLLSTLWDLHYWFWVCG